MSSAASSSFSSVVQLSSQSPSIANIVSSAASSSVVASTTPSSSQASPSPSMPVNRILSPKRDPSVDRSRPGNLDPATAVTLFYQEPQPGTYTMLIRAAFTSGDKAVLLENIGAVRTMTCSSTQILVNFADAGSADVARSWPAGTILITLADGCNPSDERGVYIINKVVQPVRRAQITSTVVAFTVSKSSLQDVVDELDISYGDLITADDGSQMTSYTTTVTSYFTHSRIGTMTSSIFVSTITPTLTTATYTSMESATPISVSSIASSTVESIASSVSSSSSLSPSAQALVNELVARLPAPGPDGTITVPIKKGSTEPVVVSPPATEPFNTDPAYQNKLQDIMTADHLDTPETLVTDAANALGDDESNVTPDSPIKLGPSDYSGTDDATYDNAPLVQVTGTSSTPKRSIPARAASAPAPRAAIGPVDGKQLATRNSLAKRDGWDTFFEVMGDDLIGEICDICGAIAAGKDLYDGLKCLFGSCPSPPQVTITMLEGKTTQDLSFSSTLTQNGKIYGDSKATVLCVNCYVKISSLKVEGTVRVLPKQMHVKENFVMGAKFTMTQTSEVSLLYNIRLNGAGSGSFDRAVSTYDYDSATVPGVVTVKPKFMYGLGLTYESAQAIDVQAGAVIKLSGASADVDIKEQTASNSRNWQGSAQVTYPKLTQPGRVALSPYIKTDFQLSLTIFGQVLEKAVVLTSQTNMGFDAEVLTTSQVVTRRSVGAQPQLDGTHDLTKRLSVASLFSSVTAARDRILAIARAAAAAAAAAGQPVPTPTPNVCNAGSMRLNAIMNTKYQAVVGGKSNVLIDQPNKFGSQCLPFAALASSAIPSRTPTPTPTPTPVRSPTSSPSPSPIGSSSQSPPVQSPSPSPIQSPAAPSASSCGNSLYGFYPPTGSNCFKVVGHGQSFIEGKYLYSGGGGSPYLGYQDQPASFFYLDSNGYMYEATMGSVMATDRTDGGAWMNFISPANLGSMPRAVCTKDATTKGLSCFQTSTNVLSIAGSSIQDSRSNIPMFGVPYSFFKPITLTFEDAACPAPCPTPTPTPRTTLSPSPSPSPAPSPSANAQCSNSLTWFAPSGSTCFTVTGHGPSHVEGQLLGMRPGSSGAALGWGYAPSIYTIDSQGTVWVASEIGNGWVMSTLPIDGYDPWIAFFPPSFTYEGKAAPKATCSLGTSEKALKCSLKGFSTWIVAPTHNFYSSTDDRSGNPIFGVPNGPWVSMTLTYNEVACPVKCGPSSPSPALPSSTSPSNPQATPAYPLSSSIPVEIAVTPSPSVAPRPSSAASPSVVTPSPSIASSSVTPSPTPASMQPCGGYSPGGNFVISGATYSVYCGVTGSSPVTKLDAIFLPSFKECMASCNITTGCRAVMFREIAPVNGAYQCTRYSALGLPQDDGFDWTDTFDIAFKVRSANGSTS